MQLPPNLTSLTFGADFNQPVERLRLPESLRELSFQCSDYFDQPIEHIDSAIFTHTSRSVTGLSSAHRGHCSCNIRNSKELQLSRYLNHPIERLQLPSTLRSLWLGYNFNHPIERLQLQHTQLTELSLNGSFNHPIEQLQLPVTLRRLELAAAFNQPIARLVLPPGMEVLDLSACAHFRHPIDRLQLPLRLRVMKCMLHTPCRSKQSCGALPPDECGVVMTVCTVSRCRPAPRDQHPNV